ncbi:MAG: AAA family ATPase [Acidimicrobiales bacterium]
MEQGEHLTDEVPSASELRRPQDVISALEHFGYLADESLATVVYLALRMRRPLFLEGEAGVGKTEVAKVLARWTGGELLRIQCYDGIDMSQAAYEWDYSRQLLHLRAAEAAGRTDGSGPTVEDELFSERFLVRRPLLRAIENAGRAEVAPVLLIDEIDRADDEFEALLLEILADYTVTVPELGTFSADRPPVVVITSNRTRDVHDALKRRCLYHWVEHPSLEREVAIVELKVPGVDRDLARQLAAAAAELRHMGLYKVPGVAETIDWAQALTALGAHRLDEITMEHTLGSVLKYREDTERVREAGMAQLLTAALGPED